MRKHSWKILGIFVASLLIAVCAVQRQGNAAELLMFKAKDCVISQKFDRETGDDYAKTEAARIFPLRRVDISAPDAGVRLEKSVTMTPTFVFVDQGREIGRFEGYPGHDHFLRLLDEVAAVYVKSRTSR